MAESAATSNRMLERVAMVLDAVDGSSASASELARRTGLSVSTVHRLALSMVEYGFLRRIDDGDFKLGHRFVRTALESIAAPVLTELRNATGETAQLWIRRGERRICRVTMDSQHELKATLPAGSVLELPNGSSGRLLSRDPEALDSVEQHGWVESVGRRTPGLGSVSAPVMLRDQMIATLCLAMPLIRVETSPGLDFGEKVVRAARLIGTELEMGKQL
ncbi:IclR family transcriptional regulator [Paeniglutamicibacter sulfureus]|uniref:DNA-binding IclR family transcriptional regulator n=1 Tax=Paeniglutamicibacter sulfureus TaxID=43666 RepID=A0ABU2BL18_9MICC|nr:helix-turn-helix domain-containing protein [Paeniglutamicibacter sulfureus]MDR7358679.1 DNA-binding IclR family transcriptional regulator [Paeniglutamicibacter sulfureus]